MPPSHPEMSAATVWLKSCNFEPASQGCGGSQEKRKTLAEARLGSREAFAKLVVPYAPGLYRRALWMTGNPADAEDAHQEALMKAFSRLGQFTGEQAEAGDDFHAWVSRITTNASIDLVRRRRDGKTVALEEQGCTPEETIAGRLTARDDNPEERYARRELRMRVAAAIARLAPDLRQACLLRDVLQHSTQEVAERLGISTVAVRLRLFRAHRKLREELRHALQTKQQRVPRFVEQVRIDARRAEKRAGEFLPANALAEFACGD